MDKATLDKPPEQKSQYDMIEAAFGIGKSLGQASRPHTSTTGL
jgi:hypothetical protein